MKNKFKPGQKVIVIGPCDPYKWEAPNTVGIVVEKPSTGFEGDVTRWVQVEFPGWTEGYHFAAGSTGGPCQFIPPENLKLVESDNVESLLARYEI